MDNKKTYKASFSNTPESEKNYLKAKHCELLISVGQPYHEDEKFRATVKEANRLFKKCTIIVGDTLQRYTLAIKDAEHRSPEELYELSKKLGDEWIERNRPIMEEEFQIPFNIVRWDYFLESDKFKKDIVIIKNLYNEDNRYKEIIQETIDAFLLRNLKNDVLYDTFCNYSRDFLLEESACVLQYKDLGCEFEIYHTITKLYSIICECLEGAREVIPKQLGVKFKSTYKEDKKINYDQIAFDQILKSSPGHIYWKNREGVNLGSNLEQAKYFNFKKSESMIGTTVFDLVEYDLAKKITDNDLEVINTKKTYICEEEATSGKSKNTFLSYKNPLIDEKGDVVGVLGISLNITKQKRIEKELVEKNKLLAEALDAKDLFFKNISHEIKTPLSCILKTSNHLFENWDDYTDNNSRKEHLKMAIDSNERLYSVLMNLLDMSQAKSGKFNYNKTLYSFAKSTQDVISEFIDHKYRIKLQDNLSEIKSLFDPFRIEQVIRNLISNALKYGGDEDITIEISKKDNCLNFTIIDSGVGIPSDELETIFEVFTQSSRTQTAAGGSGIGLSICKKIIEDHGGKIISKNNLTKGSSFCFDIPFIENVILDDKKPVKEVIKIKPKSGGKPVLLIIDDENSILQITAMILESLGFEVIATESGDIGLIKLEKYFNKIDLVILDIMMPGLTGVDVLEKIRNDRLMRSIPVFMYSGLSEGKEVDRCTELGINGLIDKAANKETIRKYLEAYL